MSKRQDDSDILQNCPYLGLASDPSIHCGVVTPSHRCFRWPTPQPVDGDQQGEFCLSASYSECSWFTSHGEGGSRPRRGRAAMSSGRTRQLAAVAALVVVLLGLALFRPWSMLFPAAPVSGASAPVSEPVSGTANNGVASAVGTPPGGAVPSPSPVAESPAGALASPSPTTGDQTATPTPASPALATSTPSAQPSATPAAVASPTPGAAGPRSYVVKDGDHLYDLAKTFGVTVEDIMKANGLTDRAYLKVGQTLNIPAPQR